LLIGSMAVFVFSAMREQAVGRAAILMVEAVAPAVSRGPRHPPGGLAAG
jgi:Na+/H+-translocating membrane pyrophosphatase